MKVGVGTSVVKFIKGQGKPSCQYEAAYINIIILDILIHLIFINAP